MKTLSSFFLPLSLFLSLFFLTFHDSTSQNLIENTCRSCSKDDPNINYDFCTSSLQAAPASQCATLRELGMISIRLIRYNTTDTMSQVKILLKDKNLDPYVRECLRDCLELYSGAVTSIKLAMKSYSSKKYYVANVQISSIIDAATTCEDGFMEKNGSASPLTERNEITFQLSAIALSIMNLIKNNSGSLTIDSNMVQIYIVKFNGPSLSSPLFVVFPCNKDYSGILIATISHTD